MKKRKTKFGGMDKEEKKKALKFLASFAVIFLLLYGTSFLYLDLIEIGLARVLLLLLSFFGQSGWIASFTDPVIVSLSSLQFQLSFLCTGLTEFFVLTAAILSSYGLEGRKKMWGLIGAFDVVVVFNLVRILVTINLLENASLEVADLAHDLLFRISLFLAIAGFYALWFYWATREKKSR